MHEAGVRGARVTRLGADFRWPGRRLVAVVLNVAYEAWSDSKSPGLGPMGNPLPAGVFLMLASEISSASACSQSSSSKPGIDPRCRNNS